MALSWPWSPVWRSRSWWRRSWACLQACSSSPEPSGASRRPDSRADVNEATSFSPLSFLSIFHSTKFNARPIDTSDVTRRCHPEETVILRRNSSRYNLVNRLSAQSVSDETVGGLGGAPADRSEPVRSACVREPRPRRSDDGGGCGPRERRQSRADVPRLGGTRGPRPRRGHAGPTPTIRGPGHQRRLRDDRGGEALPAGEARCRAEDLPRGMAEALRPDAGAADRAPPGHQRPCTDLSHAGAGRLDRERRSPRLYDDARPSAIVPRGDQRGPPGGDAPRGEGPTCRGHQ